MDGQEKLQVQVGRRVRAMRLARGMTMAALAEAADMSVQYISEIEHGKKSMTLEKLRNLTAALDVSADYLLFGDRRGMERADAQMVLALLQEMTPLDRELLLHLLEKLTGLLREIGPERDGSGNGRL